MALYFRTISNRVNSPWYQNTNSR